LELHPLKLRDRLAELLALLRVFQRRVQRAARHSDHLRADADPARVEGLDRDLVALTDLTDDVRRGDLAMIQDQLGGRRRSDAELVLALTDAEARAAALHGECGDP